MEPQDQDEEHNPERELGAFLFGGAMALLLILLVTLVGVLIMIAIEAGT